MVFWSLGLRKTNKTLGIIGLGAIGSMVAEQAISLGMNIVAFDPGLTVDNALRLPSSLKRCAGIDEVLSESDYVSLHLPLNQSTKNLIDYEKLKEDSSFNPISPYAEGKLMVHKKIETIKNEYGWLISSGIMFNHESEFRDTNYLFMKIIKSAIDIKYNKKSTLTIGSLDLVRDWSFAGDFADAIHLICLEGNGEDFVIGSGVGHSISELVRIVFEYFDLDPEEFIEIDSNNLRPGDPLKIVSDPVKIKEKLNWETKLGFEDLILRCISKGNF